MVVGCVQKSGLEFRKIDSAAIRRHKRPNKVPAFSSAGMPCIARKRSPHFDATKLSPGFVL